MDHLIQRAADTLRSRSCARLRAADADLSREKPTVKFEGTVKFGDLLTIATILVSVPYSHLMIER